MTGARVRFDFPKEKEDLLPRGAVITYKHRVDYNLFKLNARCEVFHWKGVNVFFFIYVGAIILYSHDFTSSPCMNILFISAGFSFLLVHNMRADFDCGINAATYIENELRIQKRFNYPAKFFRLAAAYASSILTAESSVLLAVSAYILKMENQSYIKTTRKILISWFMNHKRSRILKNPVHFSCAHYTKT